MFRGFWVADRIRLWYEAPSDGAAIYGFGWNGFCHLAFILLVGLAPTWPDGEWCPSGFGVWAPWPEGAYLHLHRIPLKKLDSGILRGRIGTAVVLYLHIVSTRRHLLWVAFFIAFILLLFDLGMQEFSQGIP